MNGRRKTDKLDARALCLRLSRYLEGNREELSPIRVPSPEEQRKREGTRRRQFLKREVRCLANRAHGQVAEYCHQRLPHRWWGARHWKKLSAMLDAWLLGTITLANGTYMHPLYHTHAGHLLMIIGLTMMAIGSAILKKIVSFRG